MQAGIKLPQFGANANADEMRRWAVFAETVGYHFVLTGDHIALTPEVQSDYPPPYYEPFTTMAWLAGQTSSIRLGFHRHRRAVPPSGPAGAYGSDAR